MQDRNYDKLINKGWEEMEMILDKELPVRRRRSLFMWLLLAGIVSTGAWAAYTYNSDDVSDRKKDQVEVAEKRSAMITSTVDNEKAIQDQDERAATSEDNLEARFSRKVDRSEMSSDKLSVTNFNDDHVSPAFSSVNVSDKTIQLKDSQAEVHSLEMNSSLLYSDPIPTTNEALLELEETRNLNKISENFTDVKESTNDRFSDISLQTLRITNFTPIFNTDELSPKSNIDLNNSLNRSKRRLPLYFSLEAGLEFARFRDMKGYYLGMGFEKNISRRWSLSTGVRYHALDEQGLSSATLLRNNEQDFVEAGDVLSDLPENEFVNVDVVNSLDEKQYEEVYESLDRISVLSIPLDVNFQLNRKSYLGLGIQYQALLSSAPSILSLRDGNVLGANFDVRAVNVATQNLWGLTTSFRYKIYKGLHFKAQGHLGLTGVLKTTDNQGIRNTLSAINAGIVYRL